LKSLRLLTTAVVALAVLPVSPAAPDEGDTYTATGTAPAAVKASATASYTIALSNSASSPDTANKTTIAIPSGFTVDAATVIAQTSAAQTCVAATWIPNGNLIVGGVIRLKSPNSSSGLCPGGTLTVAFSASAPSGDGSSTWTTTLADDDTAFAIQGSQPSTIVDGTPPETTITSTPQGLTNQTSASFSFTSSEAGSTFLCDLDGASTVCTSPMSYPGPLADGSHTFTVAATDGVGNPDPTPATASWTIDSTPPPAPSIDAAPSDPTQSDAASFEFSDTEDGVTFRCRLDAGPFGDCSSPTSYTALVEGQHTFEVQARDAAGNTQATSYGWTVDHTAPPAPAIGSRPPNPTNSTGATFAFSDSEAGVAFSCRLDAGSFALCATPKPYSGLAEGTHTFTVAATDAAGNRSEASYSWTVDTTPPPAPNLGSKPSNPSASADATFAFSDQENGVVFRCRLDTTAAADCSSPVTYTELIDGTHTFTVSARDLAGNSSQTSYSWVVDKAAPLAPKITGGPRPVSNAPNAAFLFTDPEQHISFRCRLDGGAFAACTSPQTYAALAEGAHVFEVVAVDDADNQSATTSYAWTIDLTPPDTAVTEGPAGAITSTSASFGFTSTEARGGFECRLDGGGFSPCSPPQGYAGLALGKHTFEVRAIDAAGNVDPTPASRTWTIIQAPDVTPPGKARLVKSIVGYGVLTLIWQAPRDADVDHFVIARTTNGHTAVVYTGAATRYQDRHFTNGVAVSYAIVTYDHARNASKAVTISPPASALLKAPRPGAVVRAPPLLRWFAVRNATYYNVQLFRNGRKILSIWPSRARLKLHRSWTYRGQTYSLTRGSYQWFVWPGFGAKSQNRYGALIGQSRFVVKR
jgi:hypothetical protein